MRRLVILVTMLMLLGGVVEAAVELKNPPEMLFSKSPDAVREMLGSPDYIKVYDYGPAKKYAYFTPDEWELIADKAPLEQGEDVFLVDVGSYQLQYHVSYAPVYLEGNRFSPAYQVKEYTIYPEGELKLGEIAKLLPVNVSKVAQGHLQTFDPPYPPALVITVPATESGLNDTYRRFRERGDVDILVEIGLGQAVKPAEVKSTTTVTYVVVKAAVPTGAGPTVDTAGLFN